MAPTWARSRVVTLLCLSARMAFSAGARRTCFRVPMCFGFGTGRHVRGREGRGRTWSFRRPSWVDTGTRRGALAVSGERLDAARGAGGYDENRFGAGGSYQRGTEIAGIMRTFTWPDTTRLFNQRGAFVRASGDRGGRGFISLAARGGGAGGELVLKLEIALFCIDIE